MSVSGLHLQRELSGVEAVLRTYSAVLRRFFSRRLRGGADVDDLVQEVCMRLVRRGNLDDVTHVQAYVFQTANSVLKDYLRRNLVRCSAEHTAQNDTLEDEDASAERVLIGKQAVGQFASALLELPERTRVIFILSRFDELDYRTIAGLQGISVSAVEKHIAKALAHFVQRVRI